MIFIQKMVLLIWKPEPHYLMAGQSKENGGRTAVVRTTIILKWYWKSENVCEEQRQQRCEFAKEPPFVTNLRPMVQSMMCTSKDQGGIEQQRVDVGTVYTITTKVGKTMCT
jgi:hypothetical protein